MLLSAYAIAAAGKGFGIALDVVSIVFAVVLIAAVVLILVMLKKQKGEAAEETAPAEPEKPAEPQKPVESEEPVEPEEPEAPEALEEDEEPEEDDETDGPDFAVMPAVLPDAPTEAFVRMRYDRSFLARLIQSDDVTKGYYCMIKAEILSYGAKSRISWKHETFRAGKLVIKMTIRGKTLCVFFALPPAEYLDTKYKVEDMSEISAYEQTPCLYRIINDRRARYSFDLIAAVMATLERTKKGEFEVTAPPYEATQPLIRRGLIRLVEGGSAGDEDEDEEIPAFHSVSVSETKVLGDEVAAALVSTSSVRYADKTKTGIINVDTLSKHFKDGETVTLEEIKKRIHGYGKITYIKVLARGVLDKALTVEADEFSIEAVKMIVLTGGKVVRTRRIGE